MARVSSMLARTVGVATVGLMGWAIGCGTRTGLYLADETPDATVDAPDAIDTLDTHADVEDTTDTSDAFDATPIGCRPGVIALDRAAPAVMWVLDRSGSMNDAMTTATGRSTRWAVLTRALAATLPSIDSTMQTGALFFPATASGTSLSCTLPGAADFTPARGNVAPIIARMNATRPGGATPTSGALDEAGKLLLSERAASTARTIVLATDGAPGCNDALDAATCRCVSTTMSCRGRPDLCLDDARTIATIEAYRKLSVPTFVIGIHATSETSFDDVLDAMANAGGRPNLTGAHRYYQATSEAELDTALVAIRDQVGACTYLTTSVPDAAGSLVVTISGVVVPYDPSGVEGWSWADEANGQIVLFGTACESAKTATKVEAVVECSDD